MDAPLYRVVADPSGECGEAKNWHFKGLPQRVLVYLIFIYLFFHLQCHALHKCIKVLPQRKHNSFTCFDIKNALKNGSYLDRFGSYKGILFQIRVPF